VFEPVIRRSAGLGKAQDRDADRYEYAYAFCDVLVVGGGVAGLLAARKPPRTPGKRVILLEQTPTLGGRAPVDDRD
jgi:sarcosine oxidase subunit alpha